MAGIPSEIRTPRLLLRPWRADDAERLHPILVENYEHLAPWIPARIATPAVVPLLAERLAAFAADFEADREWRFAMVTGGDETLLGEIDLFPRSAAGRVALADADRGEIGYWIRADETGHGFVTEAVRAMLEVARGVRQFSLVEIRCDAHNKPSTAIPVRLGFRISATIDETAAGPDRGSRLQIWHLALRTATT